MACKLSDTRCVYINIKYKYKYNVYTLNIYIKYKYMHLLSYLLINQIIFTNKWGMKNKLFCTNVHAVSLWGGITCPMFKIKIITYK